MVCFSLGNEKVMLGHKPFYYEHTKKYVIVFGTLFNDLFIIRKSKDGLKENKIKCGLFYSTKNKQLERLIENPKLQNQWESEFPRLSFELTGFNYAPYRKENTMNYSLNTGDNKLAKLSYAPAPYDLTFQLVAYTCYQEDLYQIMEQILPYFQPEYCVKVKEIPSLELKRDVHIVLNGVGIDLDNSGDYLQEMKVFTATFDFTLKGFYYGAIEDKPVILNLDNNLWSLPSGLNPLASYHAEGDLETKEIIESWEP